MTYTHKDSDAAYLHQRAKVELKRANEAGCPEAARAHYLLAGHYLNRALSDPSYAKVSDNEGDFAVRALAFDSGTVTVDSFAKAQALAYDADHLEDGPTREAGALQSRPLRPR